MEFYCFPAATELAIFHISRELNWRDVGGRFGVGTPPHLPHPTTTHEEPSSLVSVTRRRLHRPHSVIFWALKSRLHEAQSSCPLTIIQSAKVRRQTPPIRSCFIYVAHALYNHHLFSYYYIAGANSESDFYYSCHNRLM